MRFFNNWPVQSSEDNKYKQELNILYLNTQSIRNKKDLLEAYIADKSFTALRFTEHWLNEEEAEIPLIENYKIAISFTRKFMTKGGSIILTESKHDIIPLPKINNLSVEYYCQVSATFIKKYNLIVLCFYCSPVADFKLFMENLHKIFQDVDLSKNIIVCGDFNVNFKLKR